MIGIPLKPVDRESQETCINIYKIEDYAKVYTCDPVMLAHIEKLREAHPDEVILASSDGYANTYHVPKKYVTVRAPKKYNLTDEQLQERLARLRKPSQH